MLNRIIIIIGFFLAASLLICFSGCGKQDNQTPDPNMVKTFKVEKSANQKDIPRPVTKPPQSETDKVTGLPSSGNMDASKKPADNFVATEPVGSVNDKTKSPAVAEVTGDKNLKTEMKSLPDNKPGVPAVSVAGPVKPGEPLPTAVNEERMGPEMSYNPAGRVDPFEPLFQFKTDKNGGGSKMHQTIRDTRRDRLTPLEKLDISQLKLTGILIGSQKIAMVQESTGKGHNVKIGTYIGINSGRVVEINKDGIVIEEEVEDILGKIVTRKRELKLPKPLGEM